MNQQKMKNARTKDWYDKIWKNVDKCVFCDLKKKYIIYEENNVVLTISLYAYIDGHMMIIPRRHVTSPKELTKKEWETVRKLTYIAKKIIKKTHSHKSMWILVKQGEKGQQTVEHLHIHCLPFDDKDFCQWNYRELKNTPLENAKLYQKKFKAIKNLAARFKKKYEK